MSQTHGRYRKKKKRAEESHVYAITWIFRAILRGISASEQDLKYNYSGLLTLIITNNPNSVEATRSDT